MSGDWSEAIAEARLADIAARLAAVDGGGFAALDAAVRGLMARVPDDYRHVRAVAALARRIGEAAGQHGAALDDIERGGVLHDIGKLALPPDLLLKPSPLTEAERAIVRRHVELGAELARRVPALTGVADTILTSHEWFDGTGYPRGLRGDDIPLAARIVSIADAFDVMTRRGVYATPVSVEEALRLLRAGAGSHFDPALVPTATAVLGADGERPAM